MNWTDNIKYGPPDEEGTYLCVFKNGVMETFDYREGDTHWWTEDSNCGDRIMYWAYLPPGPEKDDADPMSNENIKRTLEIVANGNVEDPEWKKLNETVIWCTPNGLFAAALNRIRELEAGHD